MLRIEHYLPYYLGCNTDKGKLMGIVGKIVILQSADGSISEHNIQKDVLIRPILKRLNSISADQSSELLEMGFSIGRPHGYSFSPSAFLFLTGLHVDLFGLIESGLAIDMDTIQQ